MKKITLTICLTFISTFSFSQWVALSSGTTNHLNSVYFLDANTGYAVGLSGTILKTINGGTLWTTLSSGTNMGLSSVFFIDVNTGYVVGEHGTILKTSNGGISWTTLMSGSNNGFNSVYFTNANTGYVVGYNYDSDNQGIIFKTSNGGTTWTSKPGGISQLLSSVFFTDANTGYTVGDYASIGVGLKTINGGTTWTGLSSCDGSISSIYFTDANIGYAVGSSYLYNLGTIFKTIDGGTTWTVIYSYTNSTLASVFFSNANTGYAVGITGTILKTINGGTTWIPLFNIAYNGFNSVYFTDPFIGYVVGPYGTILKTTNGGLLLTVSPTDSTVSSNAGFIQFIVTSNTNWYVTSDASWCTVNPPGSGSGDGIIVASYSNNTATSPRVAQITVHADDQDSIQVTVTQSKSSNGVNDVGKDDFQIYPNPSNGFFKIVPGHINNNVPLNVTVRDISGKNIFMKKFHGETEYWVDFSNKPQGFYNIILQNDEQTRIYKLSIIR